jgi:hypothetical protein
MEMFWELGNYTIYCPPDAYAGLLAMWFIIVIGTGLYFDGAFEH